jgi:hypothetical protein
MGDGRVRAWARGSVRANGVPVAESDSNGVGVTITVS